MVVAEAKFRVSKYAQDTPIAQPQPVATPASYGPYNPIQFGVPGTQQYPGADPYAIQDPNPNSCHAGYARVSGVCVPLASLPSCPAGYVRDTNTGLCVVIPPPYFPPGTTPPAGVSAYITRIQLPSYAYAGLATQISTWFKNLLYDQAAYTVRLQLPTISLDHTTPILIVPQRSSALIKSSFTIPTAATQQVVAGTITLQRHTGSTPAVVDEDTENITMFLQPIPSPTVNCPAGYHYDTTTNTCVTNATPCPSGYHLDTATNTCVPNTTPPPTGTATVVVTPTTVRRSGYVRSEGAGYKPGETVDLAIQVTYTGGTKTTRETERAESNGTWIDHQMKVPDKAGAALFSARGRTSGRVATVSLTITN